MTFIKSCSIDSRNEQSPTYEVVHETKLTSEISCPTDSCLAQLVEHKSEDLEVLVSIPTGSIEFFTIGISVRLSDRSLDWEEQKKIRQKLSPVGFETRTS